MMVYVVDAYMRHSASRSEKSLWIGYFQIIIKNTNWKYETPSIPYELKLHQRNI